MRNVTRLIERYLNVNISALYSGRLNLSLTEPEQKAALLLSHVPFLQYGVVADGGGDGGCASTQSDQFSFGRLRGNPDIHRYSNAPQ